jgi:hypothetical protein
MNPWKANIIILLISVAFTGCRQNHVTQKADPLASPESELPEKYRVTSGAKPVPNPEYSRFEDVSVASGPAKQGDQIAPQTSYNYYTPVAGLGWTAPLAGRVGSTRTDPPSTYTRMVPGYQPEPEFFSHGRTSQDIYIALTVDNDLFDYTDYYYTAGQSLELVHPAIGSSPFTYLLPGLKRSLNYFSLSLSINLYTPRYLDREDILVGDRPFAAFMTLNHHRLSLDPFKNSRLESNLEIGVIGPNSMGQTAQDIFHSDKPVGWVNQVSNDIVVNYGIRYEKAMIHRDEFDLAWFAGGQAGTLHDNLAAGIFVQAGKTAGRYLSLFPTTSGPGDMKHRIHYFFNLRLENKLVLYDATLQGGLFNRNSIYTISDDNINRYVFTGKLGAAMGYGRFSLEAEQVFLTPEFHGGLYHLWFRLKLISRLN